MSNILDWISALGFDMPGLSFMNYIVAAVLFLIIIDAAIGFLVSAVSGLIGGGRK